MDDAEPYRPPAADAGAPSESEAGTGGPEPAGLHLGPVDSPRFANPPFSLGHALPARTLSDAAPGGAESPFDENLSTEGLPTEDISNETAGENGSPDGDGAMSDLPELDALEAQIDADQIDEFASRMASNKSMSVGTNDRVVEMLLRRDEVDEKHVLEAQQKRDENHPDTSLWRVLATHKAVDKAVVYGRAARIYAFEVVDLDEHNPDHNYIKSAVESFAEDQQEQLLDLGVVPYRRETRPGGRSKIYFLTHDPMRPEVHRLVRGLGVDQFELQYAPESAVTDLISDALPRDNEYLQRLDEESAVDLGQSFEEEEDLVDQEKLEEEINRSTLINLFEATLVEAVREGASDIHIYPNAHKEVEIHFRMNGQLNHWHTEDRVHPEALLSVVKDNTMEVDRFERDAAQDGFIQRDVDGTRIRYRVSIMPIASSSQDIDSESVVIRVLDDRKVITDLGKLGLGPRALDRFEHAINQPYGMVILTGPTGSGKSTTLVAALHEVIGPEENVLTVEDPVEYIIEGARQIRLSDKLQLKDAIRSILRHDPDTVMVGEMRDRETAELAIKLANTGHLTFSTLHTNDAPSAVSRLYKMGIEPFLIAYAINLVVAQRLIRTLCPKCKEPNPEPDPVKLKQLGFSEEEIANNTIYGPSNDGSCSRCGGTGYDGRRAIAEALYFSQEIRHMIVEADEMVDEDAIRRHAEGEDGMRSLQASARQVVLNGETSVREMIRVVAT
ncbi:MAG: GspE/PulE family protein [Salinibacter sp.]